MLLLIFQFLSYQLLRYFIVKDNKLIIFVIVASLECFKPLRALGGLFHISMKGNVELDNIYKLLDYPEQEKKIMILP